MIDLTLKQVVLDIDEHGRYNVVEIDSTSDNIDLNGVTVTSSVSETRNENNNSYHYNNNSSDNSDNNDNSDNDNSDNSEYKTNDFNSAHTSEISDNCVCACENISHNNSGSAVTDNTGRKFGLSEKVIISMLCLTVLFFLIELVAGFTLNSLTILADAWHMAGDALALINGLVAISLSLRSETETHSFGWQRTLVIGAFANSIFLLAVSFITICEAVTSLADSDAHIKQPFYMLLVGVIGLAVNLIGLCMFQYYRYTLKGKTSPINLHSHSHSHGHSHSPENQDQEHLQSNNELIDLEKQEPHQHQHQHELNMRGICLHVLSDALGSVVVIVSALLNMYIESPYIVYVDPICSIIFSLLIIKSAFGLLMDSSHILMQSLPKNINVQQIKKELLSIERVTAIHELHIWQIAHGYNIATVHVTAKGNVGRVKLSKILSDCQKIFCNHHIHRSAIQIEKTS